MSAPTISPVDATALIVTKQHIDWCTAIEVQARQRGLTSVLIAAGEEKKEQVAKFWTIMERNHLGGDYTAALALAARVFVDEKEQRAIGALMSA